MPFPNSLWTSLFLFTLVSPVFSALYTTPSQLPQTTFDYIIVGAGTAGNVVANRLSEKEGVSVLVLEAGVSNEGVDAAAIPLLGPSLVPNTLYDWNYTTVEQKGYDNRVLPYSRGRMLGGSSSVNYLVYTRGSSDDFERIAKETGDSGWGWDNIKKYIPRHEKFVAPADGHDTKGEFTATAHGTDGILQISLPNFPNTLDERVMATTKELSKDFPFLEDHNGGDVLGIAWSQASIGGGARSSSATAYLSADFLKRPNLHVLINAQVTKLVQTGTQDGVAVFHGVEFATKAGEEVTTVTSTKETILSAGTIGTPTILQLSGIGDNDELTKVGIKTVFNNPSVGKNLTDHPLLANVYSVKGTESFDGLFRSTDTLHSNIERWVSNKTGPLTSSVCNHIGFFRLPDDSDLLKKFGDPSSGPKGAHLEMIFSNLWVQPGIPAPKTGSFFTITTSVTSPTSRGYTKLSSSDPFAKPTIDPNFLGTEFDRLALRQSVKLAQRFITASVWKDYITAPFGDYSRATTDDSLDAYARANAATFFHPVGTALMSPKGAQYGVTDPDLKVKGVQGLRIIDGSVLPYLPSGHTQAPIYLVAERAADLVKADNPVFGGSNSTSNGSTTGSNAGSRPGISVAVVGGAVASLLIISLTL
ncbi:Pyranose dehydrogenase 3 [Hypsizygus marmoreus]|uniref:Pyranose dehydrogenase 3 n=1 Tax=Hypsizygus marmoreus TaxID=39966 RepID=A0A369J0F7_HYPMA|nr:Pyranose dehydrogenase 3 [Hypsizygus marmoreus]